MNKNLFTSESVTEGHPDKLCDIVSDSILDEILSQDKNAHVACETFATTGTLMIMGEISTTARYDVAKIAREAVSNIGYNDPKLGFDAKSIACISILDNQSPDIAQGVNESQEARNGDKDPLSLIGAGDQGLMFGFACDETEELMPLSISLAHRLAKRLTQVRKDGILSYLRPDGKTQVTVEYDENNKIKRVDTIVLSTQHDEDISQEELHKDVKEHIIHKIVPENLIDNDTKFYINPTGKFVIGGPVGDTGLTGRKIIVDTYGGMARHGGGAFSGKDPTKVDRSASYMCRYIAKNIVKANVAKKCEVQVGYAIGVANPVSIMVETFGTENYDKKKILEAVQKTFDLRPLAIIKNLDLVNIRYKDTAAYGHMGREDIAVSWEKCDKVDELLSNLK